jgi:hypothetical protein
MGRLGTRFNSVPRHQFPLDDFTGRGFLLYCAHVLKQSDLFLTRSR